MIVLWQVLSKEPDLHDDEKACLSAEVYVKSAKSIEAQSRSDVWEIVKIYPSM